MIDDKKKLIFGWSAKCGCSFIKRLFYEYQGVNVDHLTSIHTGTYNWLHPYQFNYSKVLFIRNPYKRIVSGFVDKYCIRDFHLNIELLTFEKFIHELTTNRFTNIDLHHFTPQLSEAYDPRLTFENVMDIENIHYEYLNNLFNKEVNLSKVSKNDDDDFHANTYESPSEKKAYAYTTDKIRNMKKKPHYKCFYTKLIRDQVHKFYEADFEFFRLNGFMYELS